MTRHFLSIALAASVSMASGCSTRDAQAIDERSAAPSEQAMGSDLLMEALGARPAEALLLQPKIIGGEFAKPGDDPWQIALVPRVRPQNIAFCGGSLISARRVLTAAHCVDKETQPTQIAVVSGSINLDKGTRLAVSKITIHPGWNPSTKDNDLAVLELSAPAAYDGIPMLSSSSENVAWQPGAMARASGWGAVAMGGGPIRDLKFVEVPIVSRADCNDTVSYDGKITTNMVCAGFQKGGADSCQGDSGGPLTIVINGQPVLAGIVSWGKGCAKANKYGVYTRLANYTSWITPLMH